MFWDLITLKQKGTITPVQLVFYQVLNTFFTEILQLKTLKGLALHDILTEIHLLIHRGKRKFKNEFYPAAV